MFGQWAKCIAEESKETLGEELDRLGEPEPEARDLGAVADRPRCEAEQWLLLTEEAVLRPTAAAESEVESLDGAGFKGQMGPKRPAPAEA